MITKERILIDFGRDLYFASVEQQRSGGMVSLPAGREVDWTRYLTALGERKSPSAAPPRIFSLIHREPAAPESEVSYWPLFPLELSKRVFVPSSEEAGYSPEKMQDDFESEYRKINDSDDRLFFLSFFHLMQKYAWAMPSFHCGSGVPLFEEWKAVCALVFAGPEDIASGPSPAYTLLGGDIPGIQDFVYTVASAGAARGLRGRSFFVQLVGDAVIQRLLSELGLSIANIVYAAGGNFMLLAPALENTIAGRSVGDILQKLSAEVETVLLKHFEGDLSVCLAWKPVKLQQIFSREFAETCSREVKASIAAAKQQRFGHIIQDSWDALFAPQNKPGNRHCKICHRILAGSDVSREGQDGYLCKHCEGFEELARKLSDASAICLAEEEPARPGFWQKALHEISQKWVLLLPSGHRPPSCRSLVYEVNHTAFVQAGSAGFRWLAQLAPRASAGDLELYQQAHDPDESEPKVGESIRTFDHMARSAPGISKLGFLRMDVDNLGSLMVSGLKERGMPETSTLSSAVDRFFSGWLNEICKRVNQNAQVALPERGDGLYVIYAGGDDLFVVGSWDLIPELAREIHDDFQEYTGRHPALHISAGILLEDSKFPLYQAAERAGEAEDQAKQHRRDGYEKDALSFLGIALKWQDWQQVEEFRRIIEACLNHEETPRALLQVILNIYGQYEDQAKSAAKTTKGRRPPVLYGPWMWRAVYSLTRLAYRVKDKAVRSEILSLQNAASSPDQITLLALAARWVDLYTRKEKK